jgi:hypothetical protein
MLGFLDRVPNDGRRSHSRRSIRVDVIGGQPLPADSHESICFPSSARVAEGVASLPSRTRRR